MIAPLFKLYTEETPMASDPRALLQKVFGMPRHPRCWLTHTQAEKAASGASSGFSLFGGRSEKWENAVELYTQAANAFRMQKQSKCPRGRVAWANIADWFTLQ